MNFSEYIFIFSGMSPFEAFFGRKSNRGINLLQAGQGYIDPGEIDVEMEGHTQQFMEVC